MMVNEMPERIQPPMMVRFRPILIAEPPVEDIAEVRQPVDDDQHPEGVRKFHPLGVLQDGAAENAEDQDAEEVEDPGQREDDRVPAQVRLPDALERGRGGVLDAECMGQGVGFLGLTALLELGQLVVQFELRRFLQFLCDDPHDDHCRNGRHQVQGAPAKGRKEDEGEGAGEQEAQRPAALDEGVVEAGALALVRDFGTW